ncbi:hypothetical protein TSUD_375480 [Trifolium subterraneum]|uniref:Uncharacterized protein n=1 Tax=Trifolium subterraneum TaxID=3900 RepID=A0A2Z6NR17_TRISU|nr:hypothetical protein TSUD_375480 [Trifolium subterraneum]
MNFLLDSNVEALAFNYLNFGLITILNNLWTWLALLTAALSFWKIRSSGCPKEPISVKVDTCVSISTVYVKDVTTETETPKKALTDVFDDVDCIRKGKFTVYYEDDMQCGLIESSSGYDRLLPVAQGFEPEGELEWWKCWEKVLRLRNGDNKNGWYTCQDLTELNGNVVKIWDGSLRFVGSCIKEESWYNMSE